MRRPALVHLVALSLTVAVLTSCTSGDPDDCRPAESGGDEGTALEGGRRRLADALASGDFSDVAFTSADPQAVGEEYAAIVEGLEDLEPTVTVAEVADPSGEPPTAAATFDWTWPIGPDGWTYSSQATFSEADGQWVAEWDVATIEPSLNTKVTLDLVSLGAKRGDILGAGGLALVTNRPVVRIGIDRSKVGAGKAVASARELARLVDIDAAAYAKRVEASGPLAFVEAIVYRQDEVPHGVLSGVAGSRAARRSRPSCRSRRPRGSRRPSSARSAR